MSSRSALNNLRRFFPNIRVVKDARSDSYVEVTRKDLNSARVRDHKTCAMAVACKRKFHADGAIISLGTAYVVKGDTAIRYRVPESVSREIVSFDRNGGFKQGEYHLRAPAPSQRLGTVRKKHTGEKHPHRRVKFHFTDDIRASLRA